MQLFVEIIETQRCLVAKDNELHPGACDGNVHAAKVAQETDIAFGIVSDQGNQDDVALLSLESVNGVDGNQAPVRFEERLFFTIWRRYCTWARYGEMTPTSICSSRIRCLPIFSK